MLQWVVPAAIAVAAAGYALYRRRQSAKSEPFFSTDDLAGATKEDLDQLLKQHEITQDQWLVWTERLRAQGAQGQGRFYSTDDLEGATLEDLNELLRSKDITPDQWTIWTERLRRGGK